jgi:(p)ppGpp synthase/HD superfamily hydrolase
MAIPLSRVPPVSWEAPGNTTASQVRRMNPGEQLSKMLLLATERHHDTFDKGGAPYILHPLTVMHYLKSSDEELQCIALGHDLIEDTYPTLGAGVRALIDAGFSYRVINGIAILTKLPGQSYEAYKETVKSNPDTVLVKMADLRHNSDIRRLKGVAPKDIERAIRYHQFFLELQELNSTSTSP